MVKYYHRGIRRCRAGRVLFWFAAAAFLILLPGCAKKTKAELRSFAPADSIIYIETNDLGEILKSFAESPAWREIAETSPDFSAASGIRAGIAVSGFKASEGSVSLSIKPKFIAVIDPDSWESVNEAILKSRIEKFFPQANFEKKDKRLIWKLGEGSEIFAELSEDIVFIGNDQEFLEKALAVKMGQAPSLMQNQTLEELRREDTLAYGAVSKEGIRELSNFLAISKAIESSDEDIVRSFIAKILPEILQKSIEELRWKAIKNEKGIEDSFFLRLNPGVGQGLNDAFKASGGAKDEVIKRIPANIHSATLYSFASPKTAFLGGVKSIQTQTDELTGKMIERFAGISLLAYGIKDPEKFFAGIDDQIASARFDEDGDDSFLLVKIKDEAKLKASIDQEEFSLKIIDGYGYIGEEEIIEKAAAEQKMQGMEMGSSPILSFASESGSNEKFIRNFTTLKAPAAQNPAYSITYTDMRPDGIHRKRISSFGLASDLFLLAKEE